MRRCTPRVNANICKALFNGSHGSTDHEYVICQRSRVKYLLVSDYPNRALLPNSANFDSPALQLRQLNVKHQVVHSHNMPPLYDDEILSRRHLTHNQWIILSTVLIHQECVYGIT